jgi:hypothetical protein
MAALAAILLPSSLTAQITFQRTYGGAGDDWGQSVQQTTDGGYIIAGYTTSFGVSGKDVYLIKTDAHGDTLWTRTYGGGSDDLSYSVQLTTDGGYVVAGRTYSFGAGFWDVYLLKTNASGDTLWTRTYGGASSDGGKSVQQTSDGGYLVAGYTASLGAGASDVYLIKTDANGDSQWTKAYGGWSDECGCSVRQTTDNGYVVAGYTWSFGAGYGDACLIKTDGLGDTMWTRTFGGTRYDEGYSVLQTAESDFVLVGYTASSGAGAEDVYLIKTNANGDTVWTRTFGGIVADIGYSVQQTVDGGYVVGGNTWSFGGIMSGVWLIKADTHGDTLWTRTYGGNRADEGYSVQQTADGGYIITGTTTSFGAGGYDVYLIKTDSLGNVGVAEPKTSPPRAPALSLTCEPNPFRTRTAISLQPMADSPAGLAVFDASGRCVRTLTVNRAPYTVWDGKDDLGHALPSGTYFMRLDAAGQHVTARLVLQR